MSVYQSWSPRWPWNMYLSTSLRVKNLKPQQFWLHQDTVYAGKIDSIWKQAQLTSLPVLESIIYYIILTLSVWINEEAELLNWLQGFHFVTMAFQNLCLCTWLYTCTTHAYTLGSVQELRQLMLYFLWIKTIQKLVFRIKIRTRQRFGSLTKLFKFIKKQLNISI